MVPGGDSVSCVRICRLVLCAPDLVPIPRITRRSSYSTRNVLRVLVAQRTIFPTPPYKLSNHSIVSVGPSRRLTAFSSRRLLGIQLLNRPCRRRSCFPTISPKRNTYFIYAYIKTYVILKPIENRPIYNSSKTTAGGPKSNSVY